MTAHAGLPVKGYLPQSGDNVAVVNANKEHEERILRVMDEMARDLEYDGRMVALARTHIQTGFMWLNRAVFQPSRVALPEDAPPLPHPIPQDGG